MKRIYQIDDYDWYIATSEKHALELAMENTGCSLEDYDNGDGCHPLTIKELWEFKYLYDWQNNSKKSRSALLQIFVMMITGKWKVGFFASSEY